MEIWKDFDGDYEVSNMGQVRSVTRIVKSTFGGEYIKPGRILKQSDNGEGYAQVGICKDGKKKTERVHRLVAIMFIPNPQKLPKVNHKDTNKRNNCADNLEWCTQLFNVTHAKVHGLMRKGETAVSSVLTADAVRDIKNLMKAGCSNRQLADTFGVHPGTINCIRTGRNWSHIESD